MKVTKRKTVANMVRRLREEYSLSQAEIARLTGLSEATISRIINGIDPEKLVFGTIILLGLSYALSKMKLPPKDAATEARDKRRRDKLKGLEGRKLKLMRVEMDLTQVQLAERLGVSDAAVCRWEKGVVKAEHLPIITFAMMEVQYQLKCEQLAPARSRATVTRSRATAKRANAPTSVTEDMALVWLDDFLANFA